MKQGTGSAEGFLSWDLGDSPPLWFWTGFSHYFPVTSIWGEWLPSYLHGKHISGEALIVTWPKNLVYNWVAPGSLLPKPLQHPCGFVLDIFQGPSLTWPAWMVANPRRNMRWKHSNLSHFMAVHSWYLDLQWSTDITWQDMELHDIKYHPRYMRGQATVVD